MYSKEIMLTNEAGLHARPANEFVKKAGKFKSDIHVEFRGRTVNAKSIIALMSAGIPSGSVICISAEGEDEQQAVEALIELIITNFDEGQNI